MDIIKWSVPPAYAHLYEIENGGVAFVAFLWGNGRGNCYIIDTLKIFH